MAEPPVRRRPTPLRARIVWIIFRKELLETLRDRRTLFMMIVLPMLMYPLMILTVGKVAIERSEAQDAKRSRVALWGDPPPELSQRLADAGTFDIEPGGGAPPGLTDDLAAGSLPPPAAEPTTREPRDRPGWEQKQDEPPGPDAPVREAAARAVAAGHDAVLVVWPDVAKSREQGLGHLAIYYDSLRPSSAKARERLGDELRAYRLGVLRAREVLRGEPEGSAVAVLSRAMDVATRVHRVKNILAWLVPSAFLFLAMLGGLYPAIDLTAGEKERNTMQTLLCAPVSSLEIVSGKFLAVWLLSVIAGLANVISLVAVFVRVSTAGLSAAGLGTLALALSMLLPVTFVLASVFLVAGVLARDFKDGQNLIMPLILVLTVPLVIGGMPGIQLEATTAFLPVVNVVLAMKGVILGEARAELVGLALLSSGVYAALSLALAARIFEHEQLLLGGKASAGAILAAIRGHREPSPSMSVIAFGLVMVVLFYGSMLLDRASVVVMLLVVEVMFVALPALLLARGLGYDLRSTFSLRWPSPRAAAGAVLLAVSACPVVLTVVMRLAPPPESLMRQLNELVAQPTHSLPVALLVFAILPGVCEELLCRGLLLSGFRRLGGPVAVFASAVLFALLHASAFRLLPTMLLGLAAGYAVWRSGSILTGMVFHAVNNAIAVVVTRAAPMPAGDADPALLQIPWEWTVAGAVGVLIAVVILHGPTQVATRPVAEARPDP